MVGAKRQKKGELMAQRVLVIDDSPDIHPLVRARIQTDEVQVLHAHDAAEGMDLVRQHPPDLILLDLDMPGKDGLSLCTELKDDPELVGIPVIFLTGTIDVSTKVQAFELGAVDYVTKPFDAVELKARVRAALRTRRYQDLLATRAQIDALTGLWNRGYFNDRLATEISVTARQASPLTVIMVDIDHFKTINDTYGHPFGDAVIQRVAGTFNTVSRDSDVVCRYGGEEFALILRDTPGAAGVNLAERLREAVAAIGFRHGRQPVQVTASFGLASSDRLEGTQPLAAAALLEAADGALYRAKSDGRNQVASLG